MASKHLVGRSILALAALVAFALVCCVGETDPAANCAPRSCSAQGIECGTVNDGCGGTVACGSCESGVCTAGKCACVPKTCPDLGAQCGSASDGCGGTLDCGTCTKASDGCNTQTHVCECKPKDCKTEGVECGTIPDGCGGTLTCGTCSGSTPNCNAGKCGATPCVPKTCVELGKNCDQASDGCGGILPCGTCTAPKTCGGSGTPNVCGCTPKTCSQLGKNCGSIPDQCGGTLSCGSCTSPKSCGGGGTPNVCGCTPYTCEIGDCGVRSNGCGGTINCGACPCFVSGTPVLMADGTTRAIDALRAGDLVMAFDEHTARAEPRAVVRIATHGAEESEHGLVLVNDSIRATPNHPFWVAGHRVRADRLAVGDVIQTAVVDHGAVTLHERRVTSVRVVPGSVTTFDVVMSPNAGYFVGADHVAVLTKLPQ